MKTQEWQAASNSGLSPTQGQVLSLLNQRGPLRLSAIAEALAVTAPTVSDAVSALVAKGLIRKRREKQDARAISLAVTKRGKTEAARLSHWPDFLVSVVNSLSKEEQTVLLKTLVKVIRTLQEQQQLPVNRMCVNCRFFRPNQYPGAAKPHHCDFVDAPFSDQSLRLDCPDFQPAARNTAWVHWISSNPSEERRTDV